MSQNFNVVDSILVKGFQTQTRLARVANKKQQTVASWKQSNRIPYPAMVEILEAAQDEGLPIFPDDFFPPHLRRPADLVLD